MSTQETTTETTTPKKAKASKKTAKATKSAKPKKAAKPPKAKSTRSGSKAEKVLELMKRKEGATLAEIAKATDWQNHSIRGFVSGHVTKKLVSRVRSNVAIVASAVGPDRLTFLSECEQHLRMEGRCRTVILIYKDDSSSLRPSQILHLFRAP